MAVHSHDALAGLPSISAAASSCTYIVLDRQARPFLIAWPEARWKCISYPILSEIRKLLSTSSLANEAEHQSIPAKANLAFDHRGEINEFYHNIVYANSLLGDRLWRYRHFQDVPSRQIEVSDRQMIWCLDRSQRGFGRHCPTTQKSQKLAQSTHRRIR